MKKIEILKSILELRDGNRLNSLINLYNQFDLNLDEEISIQVESKHIANVLRGFEEGSFTRGEVEEWASFLELEDILDYNNDIGTVLNWLASPEINGELNVELIDRIKIILEEIGYKNPSECSF